LRKISADYIFTSLSDPLPNATLILDNSGKILDVLPKETGPYSDTERYSGIICPGFVNSHCHLELSHLKEKISPEKGLDNFIVELQGKRSASMEAIENAMEKADNEMYENGIVAVGDISNSNASFKTKAKSKIKYHTFIEVFGFNPEKADENFERALRIREEHLQFNDSVSISPHSPYSVSRELFKLIYSQCYTDNALISIHNQETEGENQMFSKGSGKMLDMLVKMGIDTSNWKATGFNSLPSVLSQLPKCNKILLVHNTFTSADDVKWTDDYSKMIWWCLCPNANLYIEKKLPDVPMLLNAGCRITIGTDSLASNHRLSVLEELKTIHRFYPDIALNDLIKCATKNGADFFGLNNFGTIEKGKSPGLNLIGNMDVKNMALTEASTVEKIV
jgi:aminodeoxyfutalosine deaminase